MTLYIRIFSLIAALTGLLLVVPAQPERPDAKEPDRTFQPDYSYTAQKGDFLPRRPRRTSHASPLLAAAPRPAHLQWFKPHSFLRENLPSRRYRN